MKSTDIMVLQERVCFFALYYKYSTIKAFRQVFSCQANVRTLNNVADKFVDLLAYRFNLLWIVSKPVDANIKKDRHKAITKDFIHDFSPNKSGS